MRTLNRFSRSVAAVVFMFALSGQAVSQEKFTVRDSWVPSGLQAGWHWGIEKGVFARRGVEVAHEDGNGSTTTSQLVGAGKFDVGYGDLSVMAIARNKGAPLISIGGLIQKTSLGVFVPQDSGIKTPKDLEGKEIIFTATSFEGPFIDPFLRNGGTSRQKVNMVSVDGASKVASYAAGRGDGMITSIPFGSPYIQATRPSNFIAFGDYGLALPSYGLLVREDTLKAKRSGLQKLVGAFYESWQAIVDGGEPAIAEAADIMAKRRPAAKLVREQSISSIREHIKYFRTPNVMDRQLGFQSEEDWKNTIATLESAKLIPTGTKPSDYFTNDLVLGK